MKNIIYVFYYKYNKGHGNFGDELNPYLISKLSGQLVEKILIPSSGIRYIFFSIKYIINNKIDFNILVTLIKQLFINDFILAIGSIISANSSKKAKIWGVGMMNSNDKIKDACFYAVRGKYTQFKIKQLGFKTPDVIGDPAILLPVVYNPVVKKKFKIGIIPHYVHYDLVNSISDNDFCVINMIDPVEKIIDSINMCEYLISTSLHGIIVSHTYGIPCLWVDFKGELLAGDNIKFMDYFSSVMIDEYIPFQLDIKNLHIDNIISLFNKYNILSLPNCDLKLIRKKLIESAPFTVKEQYKIYI